MSANAFRTVQHILLSTIAVGSLAGALSAQGPVGTWNMTMSFGDREIESKLTIEKGAGDVLTGKWSSERGESEITNVKFAKGLLTFDRKVTFGDRTMEMSFEGEIEGDELTGEILSDFGEMPVDGTRAAVAVAKDETSAKPKVSPLVGTWDVTTKSQRGERKSKLVVNADLSGSNENEQRKTAIESIALDGKKVSYRMLIARGDREFAIDFAGTLDGTTITGKYSMEGQGDIADVTAVKVMPKTVEAAAKPAAKPEAAMVGTWKLTSESERGERDSTLIVDEDLTATWQTERGDAKVSDLKVAGDTVTFAITMTFGEREFTLDFEGKLEGNAMEGVLSMEGRGEIADVTGNKVDGKKDK